MLQYNTVTSYFFVAAMVIIAPGFLLVWFLPNQKLKYVCHDLYGRGTLGMMANNFFTQ